MSLYTMGSLRTILKRISVTGEHIVGRNGVVMNDFKVETLDKTGYKRITTQATVDMDKYMAHVVINPALMDVAAVSYSPVIDANTHSGSPIVLHVKLLDRTFDLDTLDYLCYFYVCDDKLL